jgi:hypothetical protein
MQKNVGGDFKKTDPGYVSESRGDGGDFGSFVNYSNNGDRGGFNRIQTQAHSQAQGLGQGQGQMMGGQW